MEVVFFFFFFYDEVKNTNERNKSMIGGVGGENLQCDKRAVFFIGSKKSNRQVTVTTTTTQYRGPFITILYYRIFLFFFFLALIWPRENCSRPVPRQSMYILYDFFGLRFLTALFNSQRGWYTVWLGGKKKIIIKWNTLTYCGRATFAVGKLRK